ncbi:hypothetical protein BS47DRAFT_1385314 [Hydnum rufescens UP504]|uniref:Uncharacterized protein n=1 Tax=Hydnum rufescens UP504 TaxID=1448309 RepID=A0A9P6DQ55_9AGAM|nr:hypothetical protein BS47DRAFT_1385314 [Hydnum rufescens UP504]
MNSLIQARFTADGSSDEFMNKFAHEFTEVNDISLPLQTASHLLEIYETRQLHWQVRPLGHLPVPSPVQGLHLLDCAIFLFTMLGVEQARLHGVWLSAQQLLTTKEIEVVHHVHFSRFRDYLWDNATLTFCNETDCGLMKLKDDNLHNQLIANPPNSLVMIMSHPLVEESKISGWMYNIRGRQTT